MCWQCLLEKITAEILPDYFNTSNDKTSPDNRSGKKGYEPESVVTGTVNDKVYALLMPQTAKRAMRCSLRTVRYQVHWQFMSAYTMVLKQIIQER